jgi:hypothetical protein
MPSRYIGQQVFLFFLGVTARLFELGNRCFEGLQRRCIVAHAVENMAHERVILRRHPTKRPGTPSSGDAAYPSELCQCGVEIRPFG